MKIKFRENVIRVHKLMGRYELDPIIPPEETGTDAFFFVIDILKNTEAVQEYFPKVYRRESFSISPSSYTKGKRLEAFDEMLIVEDFYFDSENLTGESPDDVLQKVLKAIEDKFNEGQK